MSKGVNNFIGGTAVCFAIVTIAFLAWAVGEADTHRGIVYATWPDQECQHVRPVSSALDQRRGPSLLSGQACEVAQFFRIIDEQADRMDSLIGDLLDAVLVDQARGTFISGGGRHTVRIDLPPDLPRVMADRQRLVQVLNNLLANAARHAPDSAPIRIAAEREGLYVAVSVADEGRGIAPDQLGQLFRKYTTAGDRKGGLGSGLGLAICKGLVEAQGGRIRAESGGVGLGARFTFTIPVAEAASDRPAPARPGLPGHAPDAVPILVVDDDPETLRHLRDTLAEAGYGPLVTGDPGAVARIIRAEKPRLVLLDLMLPGTDGIELMPLVG